MRKPLGLQFDEADLAKEYLDFHLAAFINNEVKGILLLEPSEGGKIIKMRQVAVASLWQNKGVGKLIVQFSEDFAIKNNFNKIELHARQTAIPFYLSLGYSITGKLFYEVGIAHQKMFKNLNI